MQNIIILGVSGSIGKQTVEIIEQRENKNLLGFSFFNNLKYAKQLLRKHTQCKYVCCLEKYVKELKSEFPHITFFTSLEQLAQIKCYLVVVATVGFSALKPTLSAINAKNDIALANKECIVAGGNLLFEQIEKKGVKVFTIDSELNAIEQCLNGEESKKISKIILTASGGPFLNKNVNELKKVNIEEVISHPNWNMGVKISIDSANLCNKILEVIETSYYFNIDFKQIEIIIQPTSHIHSMVEFIDNSLIMQVSQPSMLLPISYALNKNSRSKINNYCKIDFNQLTNLQFITPKIEKYPILEVLNIFDKHKPYLFIAFNALNEYFNYLFRKNKISFLDISLNIISNLKTIEKFDIITIEDVFKCHKKVIKEMEIKYEYDFNDN